jgi:hypothetical protein
VENNADGTNFVNASLEKPSQFAEANALGNINKTITLDNDPDAGLERYSRRTLKLSCRVDCSKGAITRSRRPSLHAWRSRR